MKKDIIEDLRAEIIKCELSRMNNTINRIQNIIITIVFFIASFIRGYVIRRIFNKIKS